MRANFIDTSAPKKRLVGNKIYERWAAKSTSESRQNFRLLARSPPQKPSTCLWRSIGAFESEMEIVLEDDARILRDACKHAGGSFCSCTRTTNVGMSRAPIRRLAAPKTYAMCFEIRLVEATKQKK